MNVWIVNHYAIPPSMGGLVRHYYFSKYLQKKGHNIKIFTSGIIHNTNINLVKGKELFKESYQDGIEYTFVKSRAYHGNGIDRIINMIDFPFKMWKTLKIFFKQNRPDVIYASSPDLFVAFFALLFGKRYKLPVVLEVRDLWPESIVHYNGMKKSNPIIWTLYQLERWMYKEADKLIFTFEGGKKYIIDKKWDKKISLDKIEYVNNGVDLAEFAINKDKYKVSDAILENASLFKVVYVGSIRLVNHLSDLVEAAKVIREWGYDNIVFLIYVDGTEKEMLEEKCKQENLRMFFRGRVEKKYVPYILSKSDLNIVNVKNSGLVKYGCSWNKLFEYAASEKPVLSNLPTSYDLICNYHFGESKMFNTAEEYASAIIQFSKLSTSEYEEYCNNAKAVGTYFDYTILTNEIERILEESIQCKGESR